MNNEQARAAILNRKLKVEDITIPDFPPNLFIQELSARAGNALVKSCTGDDDKVDNESMLAAVIIATLRNKDDENKLVFGKADVDQPEPAYKDMLLETGLADVMDCAKRSIALSGLDDKKATENAKNAS